MSNLTEKTDAQLVREWNDCLRITGQSNNCAEIQLAVRRQSEIEREQTDRMIQKLKGAKHE